MIKYLMLATMLLTAPPTKLGDDGCKQIESGYESSSEDIESDDDCPPMWQQPKLFLIDNLVDGEGQEITYTVRTLYLKVLEKIQAAFNFNVRVHYSIAPECGTYNGAPVGTISIGPKTVTGHRRVRLNLEQQQQRSVECFAQWIEFGPYDQQVYIDFEKESIPSPGPRTRLLIQAGAMDMD